MGKSRTLQPGQLGLKPDCAMEQLGNLIQEASPSSHSCKAPKWLYDIQVHQPWCQAPHGKEFIRLSRQYNHFDRKWWGVRGNYLEDALENIPKKPKLSCR